MAEDRNCQDWEKASVRADKKEGGGRAELTTEAKATRRQGGRENGGKGAGDQSLKGGLGVGSAGGRWGER